MSLHGPAGGTAPAHDVASGCAAAASGASILAAQSPRAAAAPAAAAALDVKQPTLAACPAAGPRPAISVLGQERWAEAVLCAAWPLPPRGAPPANVLPGPCTAGPTWAPPALTAAQGLARAQAGAGHAQPSFVLASSGLVLAAAGPAIAAPAPSNVPMPVLLVPGSTGPGPAKPALGSAGGSAHAPASQDCQAALAPCLAGLGSAAALEGYERGSTAAAPALHVWGPLQPQQWDSGKISLLQGMEDPGRAPPAGGSHAGSAAPSQLPWRRKAVSEAPNPAQPSLALAGNGAVSSAAERRRAAVAALARGRSAAAARGGSHAPQSPAAPKSSARSGSGAQAPASRRASSVLQRQARPVQQGQAAGNHAHRPGHKPVPVRSAVPRKPAGSLGLAAQGAGGPASQLRHAQPAAGGYAARFRLSMAAPGTGSAPAAPGAVAQDAALTGGAAEAVHMPLADEAGAHKVVLVERAVSPAWPLSPRSAANQRTAGLQEGLHGEAAAGQRSSARQAPGSDDAGRAEALAVGKAARGVPANGGARRPPRAPALARVTNRRVVRLALEQARGLGVKYYVHWCKRAFSLPHAYAGPHASLHASFSRIIIDLWRALIFKGTCL